MAEQEPKGLGLEGWLKRLSQEFSVNTEDEQIDPSQPMDDMAKLRWLMAIDRRYMWTIPRAKPGLADEKLLQDLDGIVADYRKLLQAGPPLSSYYTEADVRKKLADALGSSAQARELLRDYSQAKQHYIAAAEIYADLGKDEQAQRCRDNLVRLKFAQDGNIDDEIERLRLRLAALPSDSIDYAETLIELAGLHSSNGDDYEAKKLLLEAELVLDRTGDPSGSDLASALTESLLSIMQGQHAGGPTRIETVMKVNELYRELYLALARICEETDPASAAGYRTRATQRDSRASNDEFSERMRRALEGDLGKIL